MLRQPEHDRMVQRDPPWVRSRSASIRVRINPFSCLAASSMAPFACGSYAGGDSRTVCAPSLSATARRKSTSA
eukprot:2596581-Alexandrium_andersonii.AAC.1